jgi:hypothetical protein
MAVAENHVVSDRTIATDRIAKALQREASGLRGKSDKQVDGVVGILASVSPEYGLYEPRWQFTIFAICSPIMLS